MSFTDQFTLVPTAIMRATTFLTQPLLLTYPVSKITSLQLILQSALTTALFSSCQGKLTLALSPIIPPPRAIHAVCIAANLSWSKWISALLGGTAFGLHISLTCVSIHTPDGRGTAIWGSLPPLPSGRAAVDNAMPASRSNLITALRSSLKRRTRPPTLAQQLLESSHEDEDAEEMFSFLSKCDIYVVPPTPTKAVLPPSLTHDTLHTPSATHGIHVVSFSDPDSDSDAGSEVDSRPPSRSSSTSDVSLSSFASSQSFSSISSVVSLISSPESEEVKNVVVDNTKTTIRRYTYAGGVSTVLTGGVMLGPIAPAPVSRLTPSQNADVDTKLTKKGSAPVWRPRIMLGSDAANWRRVGGRAVGA